MVSNDIALEPVVEQKTFTQDEVNQIVGREKVALKKAYEAKTADNHAVSAAVPDISKYKEEILTEAQQRFRQEQESIQRAQSERQREEEAFRVVDKFKAKMADGRKEISDFDDVMKDMTVAAYPSLVWLAAEESNTAEIMYEMAKTPELAASFEELANRDAVAAKARFRRIVKSIADKKQGEAVRKNASEPLSRLKPGTGGTDNGKPSFADLKRKYKT